MGRRRSPTEPHATAHIGPEDDAEGGLEAEQADVSSAPGHDSLCVASPRARLLRLNGAIPPPVVSAAAHPAPVTPALAARLRCPAPDLPPYVQRAPESSRLCLAHPSGYGDGTVEG